MLCTTTLSWGQLGSLIYTAVEQVDTDQTLTLKQDKRVQIMQLSKRGSTMQIPVD